MTEVLCVLWKNRGELKSHATVVFFFLLHWSKEEVFQKPAGIHRQIFCWNKVIFKYWFQLLW